MPPQHKALRIAGNLDIVTARSYARDLARELGFGAIDQARIGTAVSELARNIYLYAHEGTVTMRAVEQNGRQGIEIEFCDEGPGIDQIDLVMQDGYSTSRGMGLGLPGTKRLMDDFEIRSAAGAGTTIVCRKWHA